MSSIPTTVQKFHTAKTFADLVTPKQMVAIRAIANCQGVNAEAECLETFKCKPEELSRASASQFIDYLKTGNLPQGNDDRQVIRCRAKYDSRCRSCGEEIFQSDNIFWLPPAGGQRSEVYCYECGVDAGLNQEVA